MEDYKYKLSIIIPLYNAEKYIGKCLDSILNSDMPQESYEIVVIDDGSKDEGAAVVKGYQENHDNITLLSQTNQGQSVARNYGIKTCQGEYVWCVDSDDMVDSSVVNHIIILLEEHVDLDILAWRLKQVSEDGTYLRLECVQGRVPHNIVLSGRDAVIKGYNPSSVCALAIRKGLMIDNDLFFKEGITHQDVELTYRLFAAAQKVFFSSIVPYVYILHPNSTSQSKSYEKKLKYLKDEAYVVKSFRSLADKYKNDINLSKTIYNTSQNVILGLCVSLYKNRKKWKQEGLCRELIVFLKKEGLYPMKGKFDSYKKQMSALLLNIRWIIG